MQFIMEVYVCVHGCGKTCAAIPVGKIEETGHVIEMEEAHTESKKYIIRL